MGTFFKMRIYLQRIIRLGDGQVSGLQVIVILHAAYKQKSVKDVMIIILGLIIIY